jgi:hypothetical protein
MFFAIQLFGRDIPAFVVFLIVAVLVVGYFAASKGMPQRTGFSGRGRVHRCERCGYDFQIERVEQFDNGAENHFLDDRCPHCGWDQSRDNPESPFN